MRARRLGATEIQNQIVGSWQGLDEMLYMDKTMFSPSSRLDWAEVRPGISRPLEGEMSFFPVSLQASPLVIRPCLRSYLEIFLAYISECEPQVGSILLSILVGC